MTGTRAVRLVAALRLARAIVLALRLGVTVGGPIGVAVAGSIGAPVTAPVSTSISSSIGASIGPAVGGTVHRSIGGPLGAFGRGRAFGGRLGLGRAIGPARQRGDGPGPERGPDFFDAWRACGPGVLAAFGAWRGPGLVAIDLGLDRGFRLGARAGLRLGGFGLGAGGSRAGPLGRERPGAVGGARSHARGQPGRGLRSCASLGVRVGGELWLAHARYALMLGTWGSAGPTCPASGGRRVLGKRGIGPPRVTATAPTTPSTPDSGCSTATVDAGEDRSTNRQASGLLSSRAAACRRDGCSRSGPACLAAAGPRSVYQPCAV